MMHGRPLHFIKRHPWIYQGFKEALVLIAFGFLMVNARAHSPTMDEQNHLARGYALLHTGDPRLSVEHPPLINGLEALPLGNHFALPLDDPSWASADWYRFADRFLWHANEQPDLMVFLGRLPVVALTVLLIALVGRWAGEVGGPYAALVAVALTALDPNILAHGNLATTDLGITLTAFLAAYAVWRAFHSPNGWSILGAGLATGLMLASKSSAPLFWGTYGLLFTFSRLPSGRGSGGRLMCLVQRVGRYVMITTIGLFVLWAAYAFQVAPINEGGVSLPMATYWHGLQRVFFNVDAGRTSYLLGETRIGGWPLYFPITFAVKTPLPALILLAVAGGVTLTAPRRSITAFLLLPVGFYGLMVLRSSLNLGYRHLLPMLPFLYVWIGWSLTRLRRETRWGRAVRGAAVALLVWMACATFWIAPHFLAYFNPIGGGPARGWRVVADSSIDWGQDLKRLADYLSIRYGEERIRLSWFGSSYPEHYGIDYDPLPGLPHHFNLWFEDPTFDVDDPEPGLYVISVSNLVELPLVDKRFFAYFRARKPDARIGYSIYLYEVTAP
jgi:hypothetical protein